MKTVIIKSHLLSRFNRIVHGISTKIGPMNDFNFDLGNFNVYSNDKIKKNRVVFFQDLGIDLNRLVLQQQVHSNKFSVVEAPGIILENDALITTQENLFLLVTIADCIPILFFDDLNHIVGVIHSGWRGTVSKIAFNTIDFAIRELNLRPDKTYFYFGPSICPNCFEVDEDVASKFDSKYVKRNTNKFTVNLPEVNRQYLREVGIPNNNIHVSKLCTYEIETLLHSYRRDKEKSGRMLGVIGIRGNEK